MAAWALPAVAAGLACFAFGRRFIREIYSTERWLLQSGSSAVGSLVALVPWIFAK